jgi:hypothetical protein
VAEIQFVATPPASAQPAGSQPQVPISWQNWQSLKDNPAALQALSAGLPPVAAEPGPIASPPVTGAPSTFSPEGAPVGAWSNLANVESGGPYNFGNPLVLTDGTVIVHRTDNASWYKLTPRNDGSYIFGTWSQIASMPVIGGTQYAPKFFASAVLPDGRVIVEGGEYNNGSSVWTNLGAIYDPVANTWTAVTAPSGWAQIGDAQSTVLANGTFFLADCCDTGPFRSALLNPAALTWTATGTGKFDVYDEEAWALLPNGKVLTVDAYVFTGTCGTGTEIYDPATGAWTSAGNVPAILADCNTLNGNQGSYELGPNVLTYSGTVLAFGGTTSTTVAAHLAVYSTGGTWSAGTDLPFLCGNSGTQACNMADAPAGVMPNGNVLLAVAAGKFAVPANFFEYTPGGGYTAAPATADAGSTTSFYYNFVVLPTGQILSVSTYTSNIQIYTPSGTYQAAWQPVVSSVLGCLAPNGTYPLSGTQLSGLTQGAYYGDDQQANTNYPLVRIVNNSTQHVFYAKTTTFTNSVAANAPGSVRFKVAAGTEAGASTLYVVANGIPSAGTAVTVSSTCGSVQTATHDFNGDGYSDIIWRDPSSGNTSPWIMNNATALAASAFTLAGFNIVGQHDFDGNGTADLLWRDGSGNTYIWFMYGTQVTSTGYVGTISAATWTVAAVADFNGDGKADILWKDTSSNYAVWLMNGASVLQPGSLGNVSGWSVVGAGDFNGDGKADILWRDGSGNTAMWFMNGVTVGSAAGVSNPGGTWAVVATGDFNADAHTDIIWRDGSGNNAVWLMNGAAILSVGSLGNLPAATFPYFPLTGDYNGDGKSDLMWRDSSGNIYIWYMNGTAVASAAIVGNLPTNWILQSTNYE